MTTNLVARLRAYVADCRKFAADPPSYGLTPEEGEYDSALADTIEEAVSTLSKLEEDGKDGWLPIETAPKNNFLAAIWHGGRYYVVSAERVGDGVYDTREGSCVGWTPSSKHKAYWQHLPSPPRRKT